MLKKVAALIYKGDPVNTLRRKELALRDALASMQSALVAYSGGVDSSYLLSVARQVLGDSVLAVTVVSPICPGRPQFPLPPMCM